MRWLALICVIIQAIIILHPLECVELLSSLEFKDLAVDQVKVHMASQLLRNGDQEIKHIAS